VNRRALLASIGLALLPAGCLSGAADPLAPGSSPTSDLMSATASPRLDSPTLTRATGVALDWLVTRKNATYEATMSSGGVLADQDRQYVVARVRADRELESSAFRFETDNHSVVLGLLDAARSVTRSVAGLEGTTLDGAWTAAVPEILALTLPSPLETERASPSEERTDRSTGDGNVASVGTA
jgi:hypothetical protein